MKIIFQWIQCACVLILPLNLQGLSYAIQDLGALPTDESRATGINNQNTIVGYVRQGIRHNGFMWKPNDEMFVLSHPRYQLPFINNLNQVAGIFWHRTNHLLPTSTYSRHIYIDDNKRLQDLSLPDQWEVEELEEWQISPFWNGKKLRVLSFNDDQKILIASGYEDQISRFAIWQNGTFTEIDSNILSYAYEMNNQGLILGRKWAIKGNAKIPMLVLYNPVDQSIVEITKDINLLHRKLNDQGQVIIFQAAKSNWSEGKGALWDSEKGLIELEDFAPLALNNCNQIVGFQISELKNNRWVPLMWTPSEVIPLAPFIEPSCFEVRWIGGINDNGYIIGQGLFDHKQHAFVLIPQ